METNTKSVLGVCLLVFIIGNSGSSPFITNLNLGQNEVVFRLTANGTELSIIRDNDIILRGILGVKDTFSKIDCHEGFCRNTENTLNIKSTDDGMTVTWESSDSKVEFLDCFDLQKGRQNWYGGPERKVQKWPLEKQTINGSEAYVLRNTDNFAVAERYWLNSKGVYIYIDEIVPLFVDQNNLYDGMVCLNSKLEDPYINRTRNLLQYTIIVKDNSKEAHLHAVNNYLGKPTGHPNEKMIGEPIWTTWAKYKTLINDSAVLSFAQDVRSHGFRAGQLEIDDAWEKCYGDQEFNNVTFPNISNTVKKLKEMDYRVTLWVHPFVDSDCQNNANVGVEKGYFVGNTKGDINGSWWDSNNTHQVDFTNLEAAEWYSARLRKLQVNPGIDAFKFDAGETNYAPQPSVYKHVDNEKVPNILSESYIRTCAKFGPLIEVRSASRTQDLPIFVRMLDKDSNWGDQNGLYTLITTLLQMNMNGYTMVLPDMIGGNGYFGVLPTAELIVRWTQANTFMPAMQFSYLPWDTVSDEFNSLEIVKKFVDLHETYASEIIKAMNASEKVGTPVNGPIWWIDPMDAVALASDDEFLLGEDILVAPVILEGARSRNIYLPRGNWKDGNNGTIYKGPKHLENYSAPIEVLPYFIKQ